MTITPSHLPQIYPAYWGFMLGGRVRVPLLLSYADLRALPAVDQPCAVTCIGSQPGQTSLSTAVWRGVRLQTLLDQLELFPDARHAHFFAADGYTTSVPLERLPGALLAYERDGAALTPEQGYPVRLIVPGLYGYKMPRWIQRIELRETPAVGRWERRGWSTAGVIQTTSAIIHPRPLQILRGAVTLTGTAYAGERMITRIEVSIDGAPWMPVPFAPAPPHQVINWSIPWQPPAPGDYRVRVRAADSAGFIQPETAPSFPDGSSAIHAVTLRVVEV